MNIYLVGGAVRDELLGLPIQERDWVVVGSTPETLLSLGFQPVGKEFPVFLHPVTHEEYALARTERKVGKGYKGFVFFTDASVTLEEDLQRRDLTINAIAKDQAGHLIDPYHGQKDLNDKILRHVSSAFSEDPVRLLRIARFAAKLPEFQVALETNDFLKMMVAAGEISALVPERVWQELYRALGAAKPSRFFAVLKNCGALALLFPMLKELPNIDVTHFNEKQRFALLLHALDEKEIKDLCHHYKVPNEFLEIAILTKKLMRSYENLSPPTANQMLSFLKAGDALRREQRFFESLAVLDYLQPKQLIPLLKNSLRAIKHIDTTTLQAQGLRHHAFANALEARQLEALKTVLN